MPKSTEKIVVNEKTGGAKGTKLAMMSKIPPAAIWAIAERYGYGSMKYDDPTEGTGPANSNWEKGLAWSQSYDGLIRHAMQFWGGEDVDEDMVADMEKYGYGPEDLHGSQLHIAAVAWHAICLLHYSLNEEYEENDDRSKHSPWKET